MISLDKYDKQNMRKFEQLLKKDVAFQFRLKPYDFIPEGQDEQVCGTNLELISIRQLKVSIAESRIVRALDTFVAKHGETAKQVVKEAWKGAWEEIRNEDEIDEIADKAAARAINQSSELNAEEQAIDEDVEKAVAARLPSPPRLVLEQRIRRRRTPVTATEEEIAGVAAEVKKLEDLIAVQEKLGLSPLAIGADE